MYPYAAMAATPLILEIRDGDTGADWEGGEGEDTERASAKEERRGGDARKILETRKGKTITGLGEGSGGKRLGDGAQSCAEWKKGKGQERTNSCVPMERGGWGGKGVRGRRAVEPWG